MIAIEKKEPTILPGTIPPTKLKIFFWIILGLFSTYFAEVVSGSAMFPFTTLPGLFLVFPLYFLHSIVLATIVFQFGRPRFTALFAAGMLFGMYEAYMTKVLWISFLPEGPPLVLGGVAVMEFIILVFFWHALMAFILPLTIAERLLTRSRTIELFSGKPGKNVWIILAVVCGINQSLHSPSWTHSLASGAIALVVLVSMSLLWKKLQGDRYDLLSLLPNRKEFLILFVLLFLDYLLLTLTMKPEKLPSFQSQLSIWVIYGFLIGLFILHLKKARRCKPSGKDITEISSKMFVWMLGVIGLLSTILTSFLHKNTVVTIITFGAVIVTGILLFFMTVIDLFRKEKN